jgi:hypothetical protein
MNGRRGEKEGRVVKILFPYPLLIWTIENIAKDFHVVDYDAV